MHGSGLPVFNSRAKHRETLLGGNFDIKHLGNVYHPELTILSGDIYAMFCRLIRTSVSTGHKKYLLSSALIRYLFLPIPPGPKTEKEVLLVTSNKDELVIAGKIRSCLTYLGMLWDVIAPVEGRSSCCYTFKATIMS